MNKILVIQTAFIGDVILATSIVEKLRLDHPQARIDFLLRKGNESLLANHPYVNDVIVWNKRSSKYKELLRILKSVRRAKYDMVVNAQRFAASGLITGLSGAKKRIGFSKNPLSFLFTSSVSHELGSKGEENYLHEVQRNLSLLGEDNILIKPRLYPSNTDFDKVANLISQPFVTISPASVWFTKQFPSEQWAELIDELLDYRVFLLGGPADAGMAEMIRGEARHPDVAVLAGKLSMLQSAALMSRARMNYVNDSAPMHMASAMNAPVAAVFCSTIPEFGFGPISDHGLVVETQENLSCRPCGLHGKRECPLGHFDCARTIRKSQLLAPLDD